MKKRAEKQAPVSGEERAKRGADVQLMRMLMGLLTRVMGFSLASQLFLLFLVYLPFHLLFGPSLFPFFVRSNFDVIFFFVVAMLVLVVVGGVLVRRLWPFLQFYLEGKTGEDLPLSEEERRSYQLRLVRMVDAVSLYVGSLLPLLMLLNGTVDVWLSPEGRVVKLGVLLVAMLLGLLAMFALQESLLRRLHPLRRALGIYLMGDGRRNRRLSSSTFHLMMGATAVSLMLLTFKYGIDVFHDYQSSIAAEYYQGVRFSTNAQLVRVLAQERLAMVVDYLPTDMRYPAAVPEEVLDRVLGTSILRPAALLFLAYSLVAGLAVSLVVWYAIVGSENMLRFIYQCVGGILRRERRMSARIELIDLNEIGYLIGYFNLLIGQLSQLGQRVLNHGENVGKVLDILRRGSRQNRESLDELNAGVSDIEAQAQRQVESNKEISAGLGRLLADVRDIDDNLSNQRQMVEGISNQVGHFSLAVHRVEYLTAQSRQETLRLVHMVRSGEQSVRSLIDAMKGISDSSAEIEQIVEAITRIAAQTSMLSMNAAIEAAHAGDYGSGFAVVAQEVRTLSESATQQSRNIREEIQQLLQKVGQGLQLSETISQALVEINRYIDRAHDTVGLISQAMEGQSVGASKIVSSVESVVLSSRRISSWTQKQDGKSQQIQQDIGHLGQLSEAIREDTVEMRQEIGGLHKSVVAFDHILQREEEKLTELLGNTQEVFHEGREKA